jgi:enamine deaminase RidA (YjgF/YER057c/UK114 family)
MALASGINIRSTQICYSLFDQLAAADMGDLCEQYGVKILAWGTRAGGFLSDRWLGKAEPEKNQLTGRQLRSYERLIALADGWSGFQHLLNVLSQVAARHRVSVPAVSSRYMLDQPSLAGIIRSAGANPEDQVKEYTDIFSTELDRDDRTSIQRALSRLVAAPESNGKTSMRHPLLTATGDSNGHPRTSKPVYPVVKKANGKTKVLSGVVWEDIAGYCRATRSGRRILVSGTTAVHGERLIGGEDPAAQTHFVIDKIQAAIESLGGRLEDVDRTRIFVKDIKDWEQVTRVHGERFGHIQPVTTLVQAKLIGEEYLVEIEAEARVV